jgi:hypothetical protein
MKQETCTACCSIKKQGDTCRQVWSDSKPMGVGDLVTLLCGFSPQIFLRNGPQGFLMQDLYAHRGEIYLVVGESEGNVQILTPSGSGWVKKTYFRSLAR